MKCQIIITTNTSSRSDAVEVEPDLPCDKPSPNDPSVAWHIDSVKAFYGASSQLPAVLPFQTPDPDESSDSSDSDSNSEHYN